MIQYNGSKAMALGVLFLLALSMSLVLPRYWLVVVGGALLLGLFAASVDFTLGYAGILNLGSALFFAVGAYAIALSERAGFDFSTGILIAAFCALLLAFVLGITGLTNGRASVQFALLTLVVALSFEQIIISNYHFTGGSNGIPNVSRPILFGSEMSHTSFYSFTVIIVFSVLFALHQLTQSRFGRLLLLLKSEPEKALSFGFHVKSVKVVTFVISAVISSLAGCLYVSTNGIAYPGMFAIIPNMLVLVWIALGGPGTIIGPFVAAAVLTILEFELGSQFVDWYLLIIGVVFVLMVVRAPQGLFSFPIGVKVKTVENTIPSRNH